MLERNRFFGILRKKSVFIGVHLWFLNGYSNFKEQPE